MQSDLWSHLFLIFFIGFTLSAFCIMSSFFISLSCIETWTDTFCFSHVVFTFLEITKVSLTGIFGFSQKKKLSHISTQSVPQIFILGMLNAAIRVEPQIYGGHTDGTSCNYRQRTPCELWKVSELISPSSTWSERPRAGAKEGWRVKKRHRRREGWGGRLKAVGMCCFPATWSLYRCAWH